MIRISGKNIIRVISLILLYKTIHPGNIGKKLYFSYFSLVMSHKSGNSKRMLLIIGAWMLYI